MQSLRERFEAHTGDRIPRYKELRLVKAMSPSGQYRYMAGAAQGDEYLAKFYTIFSGSVISVDYAGNTCVVKCYAGMAQAACAAIDAMHFEGIVGTLAGDDTIFVLCRTPELTQQLKSSLDKMLQNG